MVRVCTYGAISENVHEMQTLSFGHTIKAVKNTHVIDILGVFVSEDSKTGRPTVLKECSYNMEHNFNLLRCQGCCSSKSHMEISN